MSWLTASIFSIQRASKKATGRSSDELDHAAAILAALPRDDFDALRTKYPDAHWMKYLDFEKYVPFTVRVCRRMDLIGAPKRKILDVGCGSGLFMHCARYFGHEAIGIDIENDLLGEMATLFRIDRRIAPVRTYECMSVTGSFDLITAMGTQFDRIETPIGRRKWGCAEWAFFLRDVERHLTGAGHVFLRINRGTELGLNEVNYDHDVFRSLEHAHRGGINFLFDRPALAIAIENLKRLSDP